MARELGTERSLLDRRSYLKLAGATVASVAGVGAGAGASAGQTDSATVLYEDFASGEYDQHYTSSYVLGEHDSTVSDAPKTGDSALKVTLPSGSHYGMHSTYDPVEAGDVDSELTEMYQSFWVRFSPNFETTSSNGKLPGVANIEPGGGKGGDASNGTNGWSARGRYQNATSDTIDVGYYVYHMGMDGNYGDHMVAATIPKGQWVHVEQHVKLNTVSGDSANADGQLRMWIDGELQLDKTDMRFTLEPERGVNALWNVYHGGGDPAPHDQAVSFDEWTVSTERVGLPDESGDGSSGDGSSGDDSSDDDSSDEETTTGDGDGTVLEVVADSDISTTQYQFTVEGNVEKRTNANELSAEGNDEVTDNGDGTMTVSGAVGNGYGDSYSVSGTVTSMDIDETKFTLRYDGEEVGVDELTGSSSTELPNKLVVDGSNRPRVASTYTFEVSGEVQKDGELGTINEYDTASDGTVSGRIIGGKDGYRFSGEITGFSLDGPANVRIEDGS